MAIMDMYLLQTGGTPRQRDKTLTLVRTDLLYTLG